MLDYKSGLQMSLTTLSFFFVSRWLGIVLLNQATMLFKMAFKNNH